RIPCRRSVAVQCRYHDLDCLNADERTRCRRTEFDVFRVTALFVASAAVSCRSLLFVHVRCFIHRWVRCVGLSAGGQRRGRGYFVAIVKSGVLFVRGKSESSSTAPVKSGEFPVIALCRTTSDGFIPKSLAAPECLRVAEKDRRKPRR
ncbi:unnamed protein product, partial [Hapterophycus canaliculatus]